MAKTCSNTYLSKSEDILKFANKFKPPPPPGDKNLWELQFCRWWGWNWVQKVDAQNKMGCKCDIIEYRSQK